jgi:Asp/Glu/hydantoin racemase
VRIMVLGAGRNTTPGTTPRALSQARERPVETRSSDSPFQEYASPGTQVDSGTPEDYEGAAEVGSGGSDRYMRWWLPVPGIVKKTVWAEQNGYDAVIQSNNFEHGVEASRLAVRIPVLGLCRTTMHVAANFADRIGVTVPLDGYYVLSRRLLEGYGLMGVVSGIKSLGFDNVPAPEEVSALRPVMFERAVEVMRGLVKEGAECIVPLGGAVIPSILDPRDLAKEVGAPVFNPREVGIRMAEMCVNAGITQSPITYRHATLV